MTKKAIISPFVFTLVMMFLYMPLIILVIYSFNDSKTMAWSGFSFRWYQELFTNSGSLWRSFGNSVIVALGSATLSSVIGTLGAIGIYWYNFKFKKILQIATFLPLILPEIIIGVSLLIFFAKVNDLLSLVGIHFPLSLFTVFLAHTTFNLPFVLLIVMARLEEFDFTIIEAAYDLGAREIDTLFKVVLPIASPGIISGFLMAVTLSLEDFVITFFVAGPGSSTLPLHVYSMIRFGVSPVINALSVLIIAVTILLAFSTKNIYKYIISK
ncbi:MAG: ABC transporter permease [Fibrobacter sp.]|jgi:spermidine/putrescine transport system permease protein|nr:ABC transporter permease [Fibrobacter sp.]